MNIRNRISVTMENEIAVVELNRPEKHNAMDLEMFLAIAESQTQLAGKTGVRAVILSGAGVDFCTGLDVKSIMKERSGMRKLLWKWLPWRANLAQQVAVGWRRLPCPVFAAVQGRCWGGGLQFALGADFRIVEPVASLSVMEGKWGLIPDMGGTLALTLGPAVLQTSVAVARDLGTYVYFPANARVRQYLAVGRSHVHRRIHASVLAGTLKPHLATGRFEEPQH